MLTAATPQMRGASLLRSKPATWATPGRCASFTSMRTANAKATRSKRPRCFRSLVIPIEERYRRRRRWLVVAGQLWPHWQWLRGLRSPRWFLHGDKHNGAVRQVVPVLWERVRAVHRAPVYDQRRRLDHRDHLRRKRWRVRRLSNSFPLSHDAADTRPGKLRWQGSVAQMRPRPVSLQGLS